jgi:hypothetical protein
MQLNIFENFLCVNFGLHLVHCEAESRFSFVTSKKVVLPVLGMKVYTGRRRIAPLILGVGARKM